MFAKKEQRRLARNAHIKIMLTEDLNGAHGPYEDFLQGVKDINKVVENGVEDEQDVRKASKSLEKVWNSFKRVYAKVKDNRKSDEESQDDYNFYSTIGR